MSITIYHGLPGGGKSYATLQDEVIEELRYGKRYVAFDYAIDLAELNAYFQENNLRCPDGQFPDIMARCHLLTEKEAREFWRYPMPKVVVPNKLEAKETLPDYGQWNDENPLTPGGVGTLYVIDEAHLKFDARAWKQTGAGLTFYMSQHRKLNDEVIMITQHLSQLESRVRNITERFIECNNNTNRRIFTIFRRNSKLVQEWRYKCPPAPVDRKIEYHLDPKLARCYRTMAGHGVAGRNVPEKRRMKGIPVYWIALPIVLGVYVMSEMPGYVGKKLSGMVREIGDPPKANPAPEAPQMRQERPETTTQRPPATANPAPDPVRPVDSRARLKVAGWIYRAGKFNVLMTNGETWTETTPGLTLDDGASLERNGLWRHGVFYPLLSGGRRDTGGVPGSGEVRAGPVTPEG